MLVPMVSTVLFNWATLSYGFSLLGIPQRQFIAASLNGFNGVSIVFKVARRDGKVVY